MNNEVSNSDDVIDSRDVIARIEELQDEQDSLVEEYREAKEEADEAEEPTERLANAINALCSYWDITPEEVADSVEALGNDADSFNGNEELAALKALADDAEGYADDWLHGATLIRESYFTEYAEELLKDIGDLPQDLPGYLVIDWEATANNIKVDYTEVDFDGVAYLVR